MRVLGLGLFSRFRGLGFRGLGGRGCMIRAPRRFIVGVVKEIS